MESNHPTSPPNYHLPQATSPEHEGGQRGQAVRYYECNFCKKGFNNAQALGGHMNIHRKERAKLRQQPHSQNHSLADIPSNAIEPSHNSPSPPTMFMWAYYASITREGHEMEADEHQGRHLLSLFSETPMHGDFVDGGRDEGNRHEEGERIIGGEAVPELDLELRLGPEPRDRMHASLKEYT